MIKCGEIEKLSCTCCKFLSLFLFRSFNFTLLQNLSRLIWVEVYSRQILNGKVSKNTLKMAENDAVNGNKEAPTDLEKKIIKQVEVTLLFLSTVRAYD